MFVIPGAIALVVEPLIFLLADRHPRRYFIAGGLAAMAGASAVCALAPSWPFLALALAVWACANGTAAAIAQATLVDRDPANRARTMTRWTLMSTVGDFAGPLLLAGLATLGIGWRGAFLVVAGVLAVHAAIAWRRLSPATVGAAKATDGTEGTEGTDSTVTDVSDDPEDAEPEPLLASMRSALRDRVLVAWLFGLALCDLLDEIFVVLTSLHLAEHHAGHGWQTVILGAFVAGGAAGLVIVERLLAKQVDERRLLIATALGCAVAYAAWLASPHLAVTAVGAVLVGATSAPLYPLVAARAYARYPGRSGLVLAASHLFTPLALALPFLLGALADRAGTHAALAALILQPIALALLARFTR